MQIVIDGGTPTNLDAYSTNTQWQAKWTSTSLTNGNHTIKITHISGAYIDIDAFTVVEPPVCRTLTLESADSGTGSAPTANPTNSTGCSSGQYYAGETITLTAKPGTGYRLDHWAGTNSPSSNILTMPDSNRTVIVYYIPIPCYTLLTSVTPTGSGTINVSPASNCAGGEYTEGTSVQLTANPGSGYVFANWSGGTSGPTNPVTIVMNSDKTITAKFNVPVGAGTYDDTNTNIAYSGNWVTGTYSGPYNNTLHYSTTAGGTATLAFIGTQVKLIYTRSTARGVMQIVIDGGTPTNLDAYSSNTQWQAKWTSPSLTNGTHTIKITHISGAYIDIDAFIIVGLPAAPVLSSPANGTATNNTRPIFAWIKPS
jgi:hypothetical protein